jgi:low affinity Fe/Cu permease
MSEDYMAYPVRQLLTRFGAWSASPIAFVIVAAYAVLWLLLDRASFDWHAVATMATWTMTLFLQRAEHRDTQAIQAKLDELLRAAGKGQSGLTKLDQKEPEEIEQHRDKAQAADRRRSPQPSNPDPDEGREVSR